MKAAKKFGSLTTISLKVLDEDSDGHEYSSVCSIANRWAEELMILSSLNRITRHDLKFRPSLKKFEQLRQRQYSEQIFATCKSVSASRMFWLVFIKFTKTYLLCRSGLKNSDSFDGYEYILDEGGGGGGDESEVEWRVVSRWDADTSQRRTFDAN